jgi:hypothetical protein
MKTTDTPPARTRTSRARLSRAGLAVLAVTMLLAAGCGVANPFAPSSTSASPGSRGADDTLALEWAQCLRQHGVDVSDPDSSGTVTLQSNGGIQHLQWGSSATDAGTPPEVQTAMNACKQYQPQGGQGPGPVDQKALDAGVKYAQCMRQHGIPMSDPIASAGGGGTEIQAHAQSGPGGVNPNSDQFKQAQNACKHFLSSGG